MICLWSYSFRDNFYIKKFENLTNLLYTINGGRELCRSLTATFRKTQNFNLTAYLIGKAKMKLNAEYYQGERK